MDRREIIVEQSRKCVIANELIQKNILKAKALYFFFP